MSRKTTVHIKATTIREDTHLVVTIHSKTTSVTLSHPLHASLLCRLWSRMVPLLSIPDHAKSILRVDFCLIHTHVLREGRTLTLDAATDFESLVTTVLVAMRDASV